MLLLIENGSLHKGFPKSHLVKTSMSTAIVPVFGKLPPAVVFVRTNPGGGGTEVDDFDANVFVTAVTLKSCTQHTIMNIIKHQEKLKVVKNVCMIN